MREKRKGHVAKGGRACVAVVVIFLVVCPVSFSMKTAQTAPWGGGGGMLAPSDPLTGWRLWEGGLRLECKMN